MTKVYIVTYVGDYDSYDVSYHKTRKGAFKYIMHRQYENWTLCRYVNSYDQLFFVVTEQEVME